MLVQFSIEVVTVAVAVWVLLYSGGRCVVRVIIPVFRFVELQIEGSKRRGGLRIVGRREKNKRLDNEGIHNTIYCCPKKTTAFETVKRLTVLTSPVCSLSRSSQPAATPSPA